MLGNAQILEKPDDNSPGTSYQERRIKKEDCESSFGSRRRWVIRYPGNPTRVTLLRYFRFNYRARHGASISRAVHSRHRSPASGTAHHMNLDSKRY